MNKVLLPGLLLYIIIMTASVQLTVEPISTTEYFTTVVAINNIPISTAEDFWLLKESLNHLDKRLNQPDWVKFVRPGAIVFYTILIVALYVCVVISRCRRLISRGLIK